MSNFSSAQFEAKVNNRDLFLDGECLNIAYDKQLQRFVLFLVKTKTKTNYTGLRGGLPPIEGHTKLQLRIYVTHNVAACKQNDASCSPSLYTLPEEILEGRITEKCSIFIVAQEEPNLDEAFIIIDDPNLP
jgi:hypothetical protein